MSDTALKGFSEDSLKTAREFVRLFLDVLELLSVDGATCREALDSDEPDFEDGVIRALAEGPVNFIITRDASERYAMTDW